MKARGTVYLLCFKRAYHHARHYLGWTQDLPERLATHARGEGARLMWALHKAKRGWTLVRTWVGLTRDEERRLHRRNNGPRLCPRCSPREVGRTEWGRQTKGGA